MDRLSRGLCWSTLLLFVLIGAGCHPANYAVFINSTDHPVILEVSWPTGPGSTYEWSVELKPQGTRKESVLLTEYWNVLGHSEQGQTLFKQRIAIDKRTLAACAVYPKYATTDPDVLLLTGLKIFFLVTDSGIYPIPREYYKDWKNHVEAIVSWTPSPSGPDRLPWWR